MPFVPDVQIFAPRVIRDQRVLRFANHTVDLLFSSPVKIKDMRVVRARRSNASGADVDYKLWSFGDPRPFIEGKQDLIQKSTLCTVPLMFKGDELTSRLAKKTPDEMSLRLLDFFKVGARLHVHVKHADDDDNLFLSLDYRLTK